MADYQTAHENMQKLELQAHVLMNKILIIPNTVKKFIMIIIISSGLVALLKIA
ncbi:hypothetical protein [Mucilaginibacter sp. 44-25]|uniref:hypothetical protein n=1 Tax=Mucilaginibacter sp. 44-25 TaxID=1895794 RepID=UPI0025DE518D|nr:hypothetical protein [Mucilaginibacter sp. 44-25]